MANETPDASDANRAQRGWLDLRTAKYHRMESGYMTAGPGIKGTGRQGDFSPSREVINKEAVNPEAEGGSDWIELRTCSIHSAPEGQAPVPPFLTGTIDDNGLFDVAPSELDRWESGG
jgi:hypothetical protein